MVLMSFFMDQDFPKRKIERKRKLRQFAFNFKFRWYHASDLLKVANSRDHKGF